ncbi:hypothetical protein KSX_12630 [Ktedonospora formicarum]|uniref:Uncharacterized protein n=1 Tax=Ktedonospora formicarum TaxID=2778364 RepID=A0A8J3MS91_9CHLR|nr:hypothetical protein KSX_12630 [Ktedonospora formicarum]
MGNNKAAVYDVPLSHAETPTLLPCFKQARFSAAQCDNIGLQRDYSEKDNCLRAKETGAETAKPTQEQSSSRTPVVLSTT